MFRLACPKGVHDNRVITYLKNEKELIDHQDFQRDPDDEGLVHYTFPGMDEDNFRYIVSQLQNQGVTMIGVDTQLTEKKIMKLTDLIKEEAANPEMSDYPNSYSADNSGWIPVSKLEQIRDEWNNKHQSGYYRDPQHRADEYMMDIEDMIDFWKSYYDNVEDKKAKDMQGTNLPVASLAEQKLRELIRKTIRQ